MNINRQATAIAIHAARTTTLLLALATMVVVVAEALNFALIWNEARKNQ